MCLQLQQAHFVTGSRTWNSISEFVSLGNCYHFGKIIFAVLCTVCHSVADKVNVSGERRISASQRLCLCRCSERGTESRSECSGALLLIFSVIWRTLPSLQFELHALFPLDLVLAHINGEDIHRDLGILDTLKQIWSKVKCENLLLQTLFCLFLQKIF